MYREEFEQLGRLLHSKVSSGETGGSFETAVRAIFEKTGAALTSAVSMKLPSFQAKIKNLPASKALQGNIKPPAYSQPTEFINKADSLPDVTKTQVATGTIDATIRPQEPIDRMNAMKQSISYL